MDITLNSEQQIVFDFIKNCYDSEENTRIILNAPAGTGKTTLIKKIYKTLKKGIIILTPTHKAKSLFEQGENFKVMTIHKFFNSQLDYDEVGTILFPFKIPQLDEKLKLIIVDEASMISTEMMEIFKNLPITIFFTCDEAQLPPINEEISPIFNYPHKKFTLTENMRSKESSDVSFVEQFRKKKRVMIKNLKVSKEFIISEFKEKGENCVVLTYTNVRKNEWNRYIREQIYSLDLQKIMEDEKLVFTGCRKVFKDELFEYYTSDIITVHEPMSIKLTLPYYPSNDKYELLEFYKFIDDNEIEWYIPINESDVEKLKKLLKYHKDYILTLNRRKTEWKKWYHFKDTYLPQLDYTYSLTVHKAQGSEWENVYVDYANLSSSDKMIRDKLIYTAVSRMKDRLYIVNFD